MAKKKGSRSARLIMGAILAIIGVVVALMGHMSGFTVLSYTVGAILIVVGIQLARDKLH